MRHPSTWSLILAALLITAAGPVVGQHFCDDPPAVTILTGENVSVSGLGSEGHPEGYSWYITPPDAPVPGSPTSTDPTTLLSPDTPGLWSVALVVDYQHYVGGSRYSSETCVTIQASSVVSSITLASTQVPTDEELAIHGHGSQWAATVTPQVQWQVDGLALGSCNGGPPPSTPGDLDCTVPANWLDPGWHTAGLLLTDPTSGQTSLATADFEVIEVIPLSVDFGWTPTEPDPGQLVHFVATTTPAIPEGNFTQVIWDMDDGTVIAYDQCPPPIGSCLEWPHFFATDGWYDVSLTVSTIDETDSQQYRVKIGDPAAPPTASFVPSPSTPLLHQTTTLTFDGECDGDCTWAWDFGDGQHSTAQNPTHAWLVPDTYTVSLTVTNPGGSDFTSMPISVSSCWLPGSPSQTGICHGGPVSLTAATGSAWLWSTGATTQTASTPMAGSYWVNIEDGAGCWGHAPATVVLGNCGDPGGDANLDGVVDAADTAAFIPELTDGDGDTVVGAGGGDLTAPGGDATGDQLLRADDILTGLYAIFD